MEKCNRCQAITSLGHRCTRDASCTLGCKYVCWQHASIYKPGKMCEMKRIKPCKVLTLKQKFPCRRGETIYWRKRTFRHEFGKPSPSLKVKREKSTVKKCDYNNLTFPCRRQKFIFNSKAEFEEYQNLKTKGPYDPSKRKKIARKANKEVKKEMEKEKLKTPIKKKTPTPPKKPVKKVMFAL